MTSAKNRIRPATRRVAGGVAAILLVATVLGGCTSARSSLGTSDSSCYLALPTATRAVGGHGQLVGVRLFTLSALQRQAPHLYADLETKPKKSQRVCVTAFKGTFTRASVAKPRGRPSGKLAVVVTLTASNELLNTVIFTRIPLRFAHTHLG